MCPPFDTAGLCEKTSRPSNRRDQWQSGRPLKASLKRIWHFLFTEYALISDVALIGKNMIGLDSNWNWLSDLRQTPKACQEFLKDLSLGLRISSKALFSKQN